MQLTDLSIFLLELTILGSTKEKLYSTRHPNNKRAVWQELEYLYQLIIIEKKLLRKIYGRVWYETARIQRRKVENMELK